MCRTSYDFPSEYCTQCTCKKCPAFRNREYVDGAGHIKTIIVLPHIKPLERSNLSSVQWDEGLALRCSDFEQHSTANHFSPWPLFPHWLSEACREAAHYIREDCKAVVSREGSVEDRADLHEAWEHGDVDDLDEVEVVEEERYNVTMMIPRSRHAFRLDYLPIVRVGTVNVRSSSKGELGCFAAIQITYEAYDQGPLINILEDVYHHWFVTGFTEAMQIWAANSMTKRHIESWGDCVNSDSDDSADETELDEVR